MKIRRIIGIVCLLIAVAFTLGATGVIKVADGYAGESQDAGRLIGVFITKEYLDLFESDRYFEENAQMLTVGGEISAEESAGYRGRLYATLTETSRKDGTGETVTMQEYIFDVEGIRFFAPYIHDEAGSYRSVLIDEGITDSNTHVTSTDEGENVSLKGTINIIPHGDAGNFYFNPVYQSSDGKVYAVNGEGVFFGGESLPGGSWSQKMTETRAETAGDTNISSGTEIEITVCVTEDPTKITLLQFDSENTLLAKTEYIPGTLPERMDTLPGARYIIVETSFREKLSRTLFQRGDSFVYAFYCRDDGICIEQACNILWKD